MMSGNGGGNEQALAHLSYHCPGLHGKGTKQDIKRKTFRQFFKENGRLIIPLVQRRYCWTDKTLWHWFEDVVRGKRDHLGIHNSGNVAVKKSSHNEADMEIMPSGSAGTGFRFLMVPQYACSTPTLSLI